MKLFGAWCCVIHVVWGISSTDVLLYYETLTQTRFQHKVVRRSVSEQHHVRHLSFEAHGRTFVLHLKQSNGVYSTDFKAYRVRAEGTPDEVNVDRKTFYTGHLINEASPSSVLLHIIDHCVISGYIKTSTETFFIEPTVESDRDHGDDDDDNDDNDEEQKNKDHVIIYREADIKGDIGRLRSKQLNDVAYSYSGHVINDQAHLRVDNVNYKSKTRFRKSPECRSLPKVCTLLLIADYLYYLNVGGGNVENTIYFMLQAINFADRIFRDTQWQYGAACFDVGVVVKSVYVYDAPSNETGPRFNQELSTEQLSNLQLLNYLQEDNPHARNECLTHLFTYRDIPDGVVGLAFIRLNSDEQVTGICSRKKNVALSSSLNFGRRLLTLESHLVTTHELGHNFGANHDEQECAPDDNKQERYLMYDRMLSGEQGNNKKFSSCSINVISKLLFQNPAKCLVERNNTMCGNGILDEGEQCDGGIIKQGDACCTRECLFKDAKFQCSDLNHRCCTNCMLSNVTKVCRNRNQMSCSDNITCDGISENCPNKTIPLNDSSACSFGDGNCRHGECVHVCKQNKMVECSCDGCFICCRNATANSVCSVLKLNQIPKEVPDGTLCDKDVGLCVRGKCEPIRKNVKDQLLKDFSFSKLGRFLKANIVGTILTFSLFVWIPASCIVHYLDKEQDEEDYMISRWLHPNNVQLLPKENKNRFRDLFKKKSNKHVSGARFHISS